MGYRRWHSDAGLYFFTLNSHQRRPILTGDLARSILRKAFENVRQLRPFDQEGIVLLPDHIHMIWRLPEGDQDYSSRIGDIKEAFTREYLDAGGSEGISTRGRIRQGYRGVWQKRFIEHCIRDYGDFRRHLDYLHSNPVKHGYVEYPFEWQWSSFHRYLQAGWYEKDWCGRVELPGLEYIEPG